MMERMSEILLLTPPLVFFSVFFFFFSFPSEVDLWSSLAGGGISPFFQRGVCPGAPSRVHSRGAASRREGLD